MKDTILHKPTGAKIPVVVDVKTKKAQEDNENRKAFSVSMLMTRWNLERDKVLEVLQHYKVPGYINQQKLSQQKEGNVSDVALFFDEYIFAIERKRQLPHVKLKSKSLESFL